MGGDDGVLIFTGWAMSTMGVTVQAVVVDVRRQIKARREIL